MTTTIGLIIIAAIALFLIIIYNRLVALRNQFRNGFAQIDVQLQRRMRKPKWPHQCAGVRDDAAGRRPA